MIFFSAFSFFFISFLLLIIISGGMRKGKKKKDNFSISFFHSLCALLLICFSRFSFVALGCLSTSLIISLFVLPLFITRIVSLPLSLFSPLLQLPGFSPLFHFFFFFFSFWFNLLLLFSRRFFFFVFHKKANLYCSTRMYWNYSLFFSWVRFLLLFHIISHDMTPKESLGKGQFLIQNYYRKKRIEVWYGWIRRCSNNKIVW